MWVLFQADEEDAEQKETAGVVLTKQEVKERKAGHNTEERKNSEERHRKGNMVTVEPDNLRE